MFKYHCRAFKGRCAIPMHLFNIDLIIFKCTIVLYIYIYIIILIVIPYEFISYNSGICFHIIEESAYTNKYILYSYMK